MRMNRFFTSYSQKGTLKMGSLLAQIFNTFADQNLYIMQDNLSILKSAKVLDMVTVANDFCLFSEKIENKEINDILNYYQKVFPLMYLKGSLLPDMVVSDETANERFVTEETWQSIFTPLKEKFGDHDVFWSTDSNNDLIKESLADIIADIYQDMKDFVLLFQDTRLAAKENSVVECARLFKVHWGPRLVIASRQIHLTLFKKEILDEMSNF